MARCSVISTTIFLMQCYFHNWIYFNFLNRNDSNCSFNSVFMCIAISIFMYFRFLSICLLHFHLPGTTTLCLKKGCHFYFCMADVDQFNNSFTAVFSDLLLRKLILKRPPHLKSVAALPCETLMRNCTTLQYGAITFNFNKCLPGMLSACSACLRWMPGLASSRHQATVISWLGATAEVGSTMIGIHSQHVPPSAPWSNDTKSTRWVDYWHSWRQRRWCLAVGLASGDQRRLTGNGSALEVVLHEYALYKSTFTYFTLLYHYTVNKDE